MIKIKIFLTLLLATHCLSRALNEHARPLVGRNFLKEQGKHVLLRDSESRESEEVEDEDMSGESQEEQKQDVEETVVENAAGVKVLALSSADEAVELRKVVLEPEVKVPIEETPKIQQAPIVEILRPNFAQSQIEAPKSVQTESKIVAPIVVQEKPIVQASAAQIDEGSINKEINQLLVKAQLEAPKKSVVAQETPKAEAAPVAASVPKSQAERQIEVPKERVDTAAQMEMKQLIIQAAELKEPISLVESDVVVPKVVEQPQSQLVESKVEMVQPKSKIENQPSAVAPFVQEMKVVKPVQLIEEPGDEKTNDVVIVVPKVVLVEQPQPQLIESKAVKSEVVQSELEKQTAQQSVIPSVLESVKEIKQDAVFPSALETKSDVNPTVVEAETPKIDNIVSEPCRAAAAVADQEEGFSKVMMIKLYLSDKLTSITSP